MIYYVNIKLGWTPLLRLAIHHDSHGCTAVLEWIAGPPPSLRGPPIHSPLQARADPEVEDWCGRTALMLTCDRGHPSAARALLEHGCDVDHADRDGRTALLCTADKMRPGRAHHAPVRRPTEKYQACATVLLEYGADVNRKWPTDFFGRQKVALEILQ